MFSTAAIDRAVLEAQWESYMPMAEICTHWTISKDNLITLRDAWSMPKRLDRARRHKPPRAERPDDAEELASQASLSLAPQIAARVTIVQATWSAEMRLSREVAKGTAFSLRHIRVDDLIQAVLDDREQDAN